MRDMGIWEHERNEETKRNEEKTVKIALENFAFGTDKQRDKPSYRDARTHLKSFFFSI